MTQIPLTSVPDPILRDANAANINQQLVSVLAKAFAGAAGAGMLARGVKGVYNTVRRNVSPPEDPSTSLLVPVPTDGRTRRPKFGEHAVEDAGGYYTPDALKKLKERRDPDDISTQPFDVANRKEALVGTAPTKIIREEVIEDNPIERFHRNLKRDLKQADIVEPVVADSLLEDEPQADSLLKNADVFGWLGDQLKGRYAANVAEHPLFPAGMVAAVGAGGMGAYRLSDWVLDQQRRRSLQQEKDQAKNQYEEALSALVRRPGPKLASEATGPQSPTGPDVIDALYHEAKEADFSGKALGALLLPWLALGGVSGVTAYNFASDRQRQNVLQKAVRRRQQQQLLSEPLVAFPQYSGSAPTTPLPQREEEVAPGMAAA